MSTAILIAEIVWLSVGGLVTIGYVGKQRKPLTPGGAVVAVLLYAAQIAGLTYVLATR